MPGEPTSATGLDGGPLFWLLGSTPWEMAICRQIGSWSIWHAEICLLVRGSCDLVTIENVCGSISCRSLLTIVSVPPVLMVRSVGAKRTESWANWSTL